MPLGSSTIAPFFPVISCSVYFGSSQHIPALSTSLSFCIFVVSFSHLIQGGLAHREVFDLQSTPIGLKLVKDVSHPSWSK